MTDRDKAVELLARKILDNQMAALERHITGVPSARCLDLPDTIRREAIAILAQIAPLLTAQAVKVMPLVWEEVDGNFSTQRVWTFDALQWMWIVQNNGGDFIWCENVSPDWLPASPVRGVFPSIEAAKAAAQADYEARILSAVEAVPLSQAVAEERERCTKVADNEMDSHVAIAAAIRKQGDIA